MLFRLSRPAGKEEEFAPPLLAESTRRPLGYSFTITVSSVTWDVTVPFEPSLIDRSA